MLRIAMQEESQRDEVIICPDEAIFGLLVKGQVEGDLSFGVEWADDFDNLGGQRFSGFALVVFIPNEAGLFGFCVVGSFLVRHGQDSFQGFQAHHLRKREICLLV